MMVGALEGRFLEMLVYALRPAWVLEIGTFSGYSSLSMAAGLAPGGRITTCELSPVHAAAARAHIARSPYADRIEVVEGPALDTVGALDGPFDFVFIDADKTNYLAYYEAVLPKLAPAWPHCGGQHLVERQRRRRQRPVRRHPRHPRLQRRRGRATRGWCACRLTVRDGVTLIRPAPSAASAAG